MPDRTSQSKLHQENTTTSSVKMPPILHTRSYTSSDSTCTAYDTSCGTHRLAIMIIIICVGILVSGILSFIFVRSRARRIARERLRIQQMHQQKLNDSFLGTAGPYPVPSTTTTTTMNDTRKSKTGMGMEMGAPPPYSPRRPERAYDAGAGQGWR